MFLVWLPTLDVHCQYVFGILLEGSCNLSPFETYAGYVVGHWTSRFILVLHTCTNSDISNYDAVCVIHE
jgi:hypothetical protein